MGRKRTKKLYFTQETEDAIVAFNKSNNQTDRNKLYDVYIRYAFDKLVENLIHTFKFYYFDVPYVDVKAEVVAFLNEKIHKFQEGKGKAFSYFSIVAKNYLIVQNNKNYHKFKSHRDVTAIDKNRNVINEVLKQEQRDIKSEFIDLYVEYWDRNLDKLFNKNRDIQIADAVVDLFRERHNIENFNKKALYILIRERTGVKTQYITKVVSSMKKKYAELFIFYTKHGRLPKQ
jgi:hypothetical protein